jgi:DNA-binding CsgD family transcriptional regulator
MEQEVQALHRTPNPRWDGAELDHLVSSRPSLDVLCLSKGMRDRLALAQLEILDRINLAASVVNREERIVGINRHCERVLGAGLTRQRDRFVATDRQNNERLRRAIRAAFKYQSNPAAESGRGFITREPEPLILFRALPLGLADINGAPCFALLMFSSVQLQSAPDAGLLCRAFGLTPAQARLARHLATGASLDAAAARLGVRKETVRNHLKQVFLRTGTCRQAELVALLSTHWLTAGDENPEPRETVAPICRA